MYYSKNSGSTLNIPRNYSGNTFRVIDETERGKIFEKEPSPEKIENKIFLESNKNCCEKTEEICEKNEQKPNNPSPLSALFSSISVEDLLLLGLIFVIHQDNPNDSTLLLLLILLLAK
jgi:hypothetical protein